MFSNYAPTGVNRNLQKFGRDAIQRRLRGIHEPAGMVGILGRGRNVYGGGSNVAHSGGGPQFGRPVGAKDVSPMQAAIHRRIAQRNRQARGATYGR
jgi:hypothetical protein